jgi:hypothetical protein
MLTKTVADVASVYDQNVNLTGYKDIVGQVVSGLPQYQEMECENKRLIAENVVLKRHIERLEAEKKQIVDENCIENVRLEIDEVVEKLDEASDAEESDAEQELAEESADESDDDIELEEIEIDGTTYFVEVGDDDEKCAIFNVTGDDEVGDEIGYMLNGEAEFD